MIKRLIIFFTLVVVLFLIGYFSHFSYLQRNTILSEISVFKVYLFNAASCFIIYLLVENAVKLIPSETGYLYLALTMVKMGVFVLLFQDSIFTKGLITNIEKTILIIPFLLFLLVESVSIGFLLTNQEINSKKTTEKKTEKGL